MSRYLEEAAEQVRRAAKDTDAACARYPINDTYQQRRIECARAFALLAAIDKGLLPQEMAESAYGQLSKAGWTG